MLPRIADFSQSHVTVLQLSEYFLKHYFFTALHAAEEVMFHCLICSIVMDMFPFTQACYVVMCNMFNILPCYVQVASSTWTTNMLRLDPAFNAGKQVSE